MKRMHWPAIARLRVSPRFLRLNWSPWGFLAVGYLGLYGLWLLLGSGSDRWVSVVSQAGSLAPGVLAALAALQVWQQKAPSAQAGWTSRNRQAWMFIGLGILLRTAAHGAALAYELTLATPAPLPSVAEPLRLAGYAFLGLGLLSYPIGPLERFGRLRLRLDMLVTSGAGATLGWLVVVRPVLAAGGEPVLAFWAALYPALDVVLLLMVLNVFLSARPARVHQALALMAAGLAVFLLADLDLTYPVLQGEYRATGAAGLGWLAGFMALGWAALAQARQWGPAAAPTGGGRRARLRTSLRSLLPLAITLVLSWYVLLDVRTSAEPDRLSAWITVVLAVLLVARQGVMAGEQELRQYALLVNSAADPAFVSDASGRLRLVNPALLAATGYASDDLLRQPATILFASGVLPLQPGQSLEHVHADGWSGEVLWRRRDGSEFLAYLSLRPLVADLPGRPALAGTAHDLTHLKQTEESLRAAYDEVAAARQALETLNTQLEAKVDEKTFSLSEAYERLARQHEALQTLDQLKSEFVSLVSHELRAPLTNVSGGIEMVLAGPGELPGRTRRSLTLVQTEIRRLTNLVETILDLSALEAGRLRLDAGPLDMQRLAEGVCQQLEARAGSERLKLRWPAGMPLAQGDERALASVLFHLIDNALKYAPEGEVVLSAAAQPGTLEVSVRDHGPGIPPAMLEKIFDKFERLNDDDDRSVYGYGLGLYMARRLLTAQQGGIRAINAPEGGACFTLWLPSLEADDGQ
ncbi:MAG: PAS domain-containing sensor histidine kinase [Anaerolineales bacterium]